MPAEPQLKAVPSSEVERFCELYERYVGYVWRSLRRSGVRSAFLEDATQDVFLYFYRVRERPDPRPPQVRLYLIARSIGSRYYRTEQRRNRKHAALEACPAPERRSHERPDRAWAWARLQTFLEALDADKAQAFVLGEIEQLTRDELGRALGINPNTAYSRLRLARERFAAVFPAQEGTQILLECRGDAPHPESQRKMWMALAPVGEGAAAEGVAHSSPPKWMAPRAIVSGAKAWMAAAVTGLVLAGAASTTPSNSNAAPLSGDMLAPENYPPPPTRGPSAATPGPSSPKRSEKPDPSASDRDKPPRDPRIKSRPHKKTTSRRQRRTKVSAPSPAHSSPGKTASTTTAQAEALLRQTRRSVRAGQYRRARDLLGQLHQRFPSYDPSRQLALSIRIHCAQDLRHLARSEWQSFLKRYPKHELLRKGILEACPDLPPR